MEIIVGMVTAFYGGYIAEPTVYKNPILTLYGSILFCGLIVLMLFSYTNQSIILIPAVFIVGMFYRHFKK